MLVKNKWYKAVIYNANWYIKVLNTDNNNVKASEYINGTLHKNVEGNFGSIGQYNFELLENLSEISRYLPLGHPDLKLIYECW